MKRKIKDLNCVLLVDDDDATNLLHKLAIQATGVETHIQITSSGEEALDYLSCKDIFADALKFPQPGLLLLDINMPGMDGWDFLAEYQKLTEEQQARIVLAVLSTSLNPEDKKRAEKFPCVMGYFRKPLTANIIEGIFEKFFPLRNIA